MGENFTTRSIITTLFKMHMVRGLKHILLSELGEESAPFAAAICPLVAYCVPPAGVLASLDDT